MTGRFALPSSVTRLGWRLALSSACVAGTLVAVSCDDSNPPPKSNASTTAEADAPVVRGTQSAIERASTQQVDQRVFRPLSGVADQPSGEARGRIPLEALPLTIDVPQSWKVQAGISGKIVLLGKLTTGEVEIMMYPRPKMKPEALDLLVRDIARAATQPSPGPNAPRTRVVQRDGMRMIEEVQRIGPPGSDPKETPYQWTVRYFVPAGGVDFNVYELAVTGLSEAMMQTDENLLRRVFDSVQIDPAALSATTRSVMR